MLKISYSEVKHKIINNYNKGYKYVLFKVICYPLNIFRDIILKKIIFSKQTVRGKFTKIYKLNYWGDKNSLSGPGSNLDSTKILRGELPKLIKQFKIKSILDAPCGDFHWMKKIYKKMNVNYCGGDIVDEIIKKNTKTYSDQNTTFIKLDIIKDKIPNADLMICRDCLIHFSYKDIFGFFKNFVKSNVKFILTTSYFNTTEFENRNIQTGDFRKIDLFKDPFFFKKEYFYEINDNSLIDIQDNKRLYLFTKEQVNTYLINSS